MADDALIYAERWPPHFAMARPERDWLRLQSTEPVKHRIAPWLGAQYCDDDALRNHIRGRLARWVQARLAHTEVLRAVAYDCLLLSRSGYPTEEVARAWHRHTGGHLHTSLVRPFVAKFLALWRRRRRTSTSRPSTTAWNSVVRSMPRRAGGAAAPRGGRRRSVRGKGGSPPTLPTETTSAFHRGFWSKMGVATQLESALPLGDWLAKQRNRYSTADWVAKAKAKMDLEAEGMSRDSILRELVLRHVKDGPADRAPAQDSAGGSDD